MEKPIMRVVLGKEARNIDRFTEWKYCVFGDEVIAGSWQSREVSITLFILDE